jgi:hypothetical protein
MTDVNLQVRKGGLAPLSAREGAIKRDISLRGITNLCWERNLKAELRSGAQSGGKPPFLTCKLALLELSLLDL